MGPHRGSVPQPRAQAGARATGPQAHFLRSARRFPQTRLCSERENPELRPGFLKAGLWGRRVCTPCPPQSPPPRPCNDPPGSGVPRSPEQGHSGSLGLQSVRRACPGSGRTLVCPGGLVGVYGCARTCGRGRRGSGPLRSSSDPRRAEGAALRPPTRRVPRRPGGTWPSSHRGGRVWGTKGGGFTHTLLSFPTQEGEPSLKGR